MKEYEGKTTGLMLDPYLPYIIRLDGHKFSTFTRPFTKPYDVRFANAMLRTAESLMLQFNPTTVYTCSDEITLCFPALKRIEGQEKDTQQIIFNGKVSKITTLSASFASVAFDRALRDQHYDPVEDKDLIERLQKSVPHFDSRVFNLPTEQEVLNNLVWRCHYDCVRNSVSGLASTYLTPRQSHKLNKNQLLQVLRDSHNVDWDAQPSHFKYGSLLKREKFPMEATDHKGNAVTAMRTRVVQRSFDILFSEENLKYVMSKYSNE